MGRRIVRGMDNLLNAIIIAICGLFVFVSVYSLLDNYYLHSGARDDSLLIYKPAANQSLSEVNLTLDKQVGWLQVFDTVIDYPLMQGKDNYEFLNKDPYGEFKLSGSIFMDSRNNGEFKDPYTVIYGHHMTEGDMFGALDAFTEESYFQKNKLGRIVTKNAQYELELFAVASENGFDTTLFNPVDRTTEEVIESLKKNSIIYTDYVPGTRIVALTTCWGDTIDSRLLVFGMIRER